MTRSFTKSIIKSAKVAVVAALALVFWAFGAAGAFFVRAQDKGTDARETVLRVYYRFDSAAIMASYMSNAATLDTIDSLATVCASNGVSGLQITSFSSLEGNFDYNKSLSERRANALKDYIVEFHPLLRSRINTNVQAESWEDLKNFVLADSRFSDSEKEEIVNVIDSNDDPDTREARLKKLPSYSRLYAAYFRSLRYAEIRFVADPRAAAAAGTGAAASTTTTGTDASGAAVSTESGAATATGTASEGSQASTSTEAGAAVSTESGAATATGTASEGSQAGTSTEDAAAAAGTSAATSTQAGTTTTEDAAAAAGTSTQTSTSTEAGATTTRESDGTAHVLFPLNGTTVEEDHATNRSVFEEISRILDGRSPEDFESVVVRSGSSIDGPVSSNDRFSRARGESLVRWIEENYPEFKDRIVLDSRGEDWDAFTEAVKADKNLDEDTRNTILEIAGSDESADKREERLRELPEWEGYIKDNILPLTRRASMHATRAKVEAPEPEALPDVEVEDEHLDVDQTRDSLDTTVAPVDTLATPVEPEVRKPLFAVSTNALYDLAITPNFAIEVPVGKKVSLYGEYAFPWWVSRDNSRAWQILKWDLGARYWLFGGRSENPMDVLIGPFAGIDLGAGYYDIEPHHKGWQGEFFTVGLEIGWAWNLGKNWRLDACVGAGWLDSPFRAYEGSSDDQHLIYQDSGKLTWFGPTKAGVSFKYIFGHKDRRSEK